eukprot:3292198-Amphidinium_carterae.1
MVVLSCALLSFSSFPLVSSVPVSGKLQGVVTSAQAVDARGHSIFWLAVACGKLETASLARESCTPWHVTLAVLQLVKVAL